jgi:N-acetylglucosamine kinase-like BadF-type ATPase
MLTDDEIWFKWAGTKGVALCWVINEDVLYDYPLSVEHSKIFLEADEVIDISDQHPEHDGITVRFIKNGEIHSSAGGFGFILGDEGSGAALGLLLITGWLKNELPLDIQTLVNTDLHLYKAEIFQAVYKNSFPSRYLASLAPFFFKHKELPWIMDRVKEQFDWFVKRYFLTLIDENQSVKVYLIGSVAYYFSEIMKEVLLQHHLELGDIVKDPMDGLIAFHSHN